MTDEELCRRCKHRFEPPNQSSCWGCADNDSFMDDKPTAATKPKPMTNGDRIRAMTDEELARKTFMWATAIAALANPHATIDGNYESEMREWLKQPAEVET